MFMAAATLFFIDIGMFFTKLYTEFSIKDRRVYRTMKLFMSAYYRF